MNIIQLDLGREWRGGQRQVLHLSRYLNLRDDMRVLVAAPKGAPLLAKAGELGIETLALPGAREWRPGNFRILHKLLKGLTYNVINTHDARSAGLGALLKLVGLIRFKLVHTRRVSFMPSGFVGVEKYRLGDRIVAVSGEIRNVLAAAGLDEENIQVIHSGIDLSRFVNVSRVRGELPTLGLIGAMTAQKGFEVFLRALALLKERPVPAWRALTVGDGPLRGSLESLARELNLADQVTFTGYRESFEILPEIDILAVPSVSGEGSSAAIKEAWATGTPLAVSDLPSNLELVQDGLSGLVARTGDPTTLADALARLLTDRELRKALATGGSQRVQLFTVEAMGAAYVDMYQELIPMPGI